jgi:hypothetical protein
MFDPNFHAKVCSSKVRYRNRTMAKHAVRQVKKANGPWMRPYECDVCGQFHLYSIGKRKTKRGLEG